MFASPKRCRWRKITEVWSEYARFELLDEDERLLLDVGFTDDGVFEVAFQEIFPLEWIIEWDSLKNIIEEGKRIAEADK